MVLSVCKGFAGTARGKIEDSPRILAKLGKPRLRVKKPLAYYNPMGYSMPYESTLQET
jgi:hypothetical protein